MRRLLRLSLQVVQSTLASSQVEPIEQESESRSRSSDEYNGYRDSSSDDLNDCSDKEDSDGHTNYNFGCETAYRNQSGHKKVRSRDQWPRNMVPLEFPPSLYEIPEELLDLGFTLSPFVLNLLLSFLLATLCVHDRPKDGRP